MELTEHIDENCIISELSASTKEGVLKELADTAFKSGKIDNAATALSALAERESLGSTGVGEQVAIPHAKLPDIEDIIIVMGISRNGIEYQASDNQPVKLFFALLSPEKQMNLHLKTLAKLSRLVKLTEFKTRVMAKEMTPAEILAVLKEEEANLG
ncbi:MAG: PTS sugar transporter subunit IIA [Deferribacterales bacterium]